MIVIPLQVLLQAPRPATQQSGATANVNQSVDQIAQTVKESAVATQQSGRACQDLSEWALAFENMVPSFLLPATGHDKLRLEQPTRVFAASTN